MKINPWSRRVWISWSVPRRGVSTGDSSSSLPGRFFHPAPGGPGSGEGWGAPPLFIPLTLAAVIGGLVLYLIHLSFRTGGAEEAGLWFSHTDLGPLAFTAGKIGASLLSALLFGVLPLPFLILTAHLAALPSKELPRRFFF